MTATDDQFPTDTTGLPEARGSEVVELGDGDRFELKIAPVAKRIGDATVRMLAYNGSIPGPTLRVHQGSEVQVDVINEGDLEATVHWHGLRLENRYDGTHETQAAMSNKGLSVASEAQTSLTNKGLSITNEAQTAITNKGNASNTVESSGITQIKGSLVKIN